MAIVPIVNKIAVAGDTIPGVCQRRLMVGAGGVVARRAVSLQNEVVAMAAQAVVAFLTRGRIYGVELGVGGNRQTGGDAVVQTVVTVWKASVMTNTAVRLFQRIKADVLHTEVLVDRWGGNIRRTRAGKKQRKASDRNRH
jgi:hypothetical protein